MKTKERLAEALKAVGASGWIVSLAREGHYDDYESPVATPKIQLMADLTQDRKSGRTKDQRVQFDELMKDISQGKYDNTREESQEWWEREGKHEFGADFPD